MLMRPGRVQSGTTEKEESMENPTGVGAQWELPGAVA
jgi:hypothetical protein